MTEEQKKERRKEYKKKYGKDTYDFFKSRNMCAHCGSKDAYTMRGRSMCAECAEKQKEYYRTNTEYFRQYSRDRYNKLKAEHKCTKCGVQLSSDRKATECEKCYRKKYLKAEIRRKTNSKMRGLGNICYMCNKNEKMAGKRVCESCYHKLCENLTKSSKKENKNDR